MTLTAKIEGVRTPVISLPLLPFPNTSIWGRADQNVLSWAVGSSTLHDKPGGPMNLRPLFLLLGGTDFGMRSQGPRPADER